MPVKVFVYVVNFKMLERKTEKVRKGLVFCSFGRNLVNLREHFRLHY